MAHDDPLFARLREATRALHDEAEATLPSFAEGLPAYRRFLETLWGFHAPMEQRFAAIGPLHASFPDLIERRKAGLLAADLEALGTDVADLPLCAELPPTSDTARAIGALYVLEGSTLGGRHVHRHLQPRLGAALDRASRFLLCYGDHTGSMWTELRARAIRAAESLDREAIVAGAVATFEAFNRWSRSARVGA